MYSSDFSVEDLRIFQCPNTVACTIMYMFYERKENKKKVKVRHTLYMYLCYLCEQI